MSAHTAAVPGTVASPERAQACNLRGSWVASNAATNAYFQALNPTTDEIRVTRGVLTATFTRRVRTFGGLSLVLVGRRGATRIEEEIDLQATAPYTVRGSTIHLGKGGYKLVHIRTELSTNGESASVSLPSTRLSTPPKDVPYNCTPRALRLVVTAALTRAR